MRFAGKLIRIAAGFVFAAAPLMAGQGSQDQQAPPSLGELARKAREKKKAAPPSTKVWTNENLPKNPFGINIVGQPLPPPEEKKGADASKPATGPGPAKNLPDALAELEQAQRELDLMEKELDLTKRDLSLEQQGFYTNPMATQDVQGQARLADKQKAIDAKKADVDKAKAHIVELQQRVDELKKTAG